MKNWHFYIYDKGRFAFLPYINYSNYPYQGPTSIGCLKRQVQFGWLIFAGIYSSKHEHNTSILDQ